MRPLDDLTFTNRLRRGVPVLTLQALPEDLGRRARHFNEHHNPHFGPYLRAQFAIGSSVVYMQMYQWPDDGTLTLFVDLDDCLEQVISPLAAARRALTALGLSDTRCTWVHTSTEQAFWEQVDPHQVAALL